MRLALICLLAACGTKAPQVAPDAPDPCDACTADQLCVQRFDGVCTLGTFCEPRATTCHDPQIGRQSCTAECEAAYCPNPYQCTARYGCDPAKPQPSPRAFTCYGP